MSTLTDKIAAEHGIDGASPFGYPACTCGYGWPIEADPGRLVRHIAEVTETAVTDEEDQ